MTRETPRRRQEIAARDLGNEIVIHDATTGTVHVLNETAREIYLACDGTRDRRQIARMLADLYAIAAEDAAKDVDEMLDRLIEIGAVE